jgi:hypothetical protein
MLLQELVSSLDLVISSQDTDRSHTGRFTKKKKTAAGAVQWSPKTGGSLLR